MGGKTSLKNLFEEKERKKSKPNPSQKCLHALRQIQNASQSPASMYSSWILLAVTHQLQTAAEQEHSKRACRKEKSVRHTVFHAVGREQKIFLLCQSSAARMTTILMQLLKYP